MPDVLDDKIRHTAELGRTAFGHNGEVYTDLRPHTTPSGITGYRFDLGEKSDPYLKVYFIADGGTYLSVWERGYGSERLRFDTPSDADPSQTLNDRFTRLNEQLDEGVFHARLEAAVDSYEATGQPQDFAWRGNTYTNLHDPGKTHVDYRFEHGQGDQLKVFFFAGDGSYVSGWSRAGQATHAHPDRTATDNLHDRLVEVDALLPASLQAPLTLEAHLTLAAEDPDGTYEFHLAGRDMVALAPDNGAHYLLSPDVDWVNDIAYSPWVEISHDGTYFSYTIGGGTSQGLSLTHHWDWSPTHNGGLGDLLYGDGLKDTLYPRLQLIEYELHGLLALSAAGIITASYSDYDVRIQPGMDTGEVRFHLDAEYQDRAGYGEVTTWVDAVFTRDADGPGTQRIVFEEDYDNLVGNGEDILVAGVVHQDTIAYQADMLDVLGYEETMVVNVDVEDVADGYAIEFGFRSVDLFEPLHCSASVSVNAGFAITASSVECSDEELEAEFEKAIVGMTAGALRVVALSDGLQAVFVVADYDFVDGTAPEYVGAFAPADDDVWFG